MRALPLFLLVLSGCPSPAENAAIGVMSAGLGVAVLLYLFRRADMTRAVLLATAMRAALLVLVAALVGCPSRLVRYAEEAERYVQAVVEREIETRDPEEVVRLYLCRQSALRTLSRVSQAHRDRGLQAGADPAVREAVQRAYSQMLHDCQDAHVQPAPQDGGARPASRLDGGLPQPDQGAPDGGALPRAPDAYGGSP